MKAVLFVCVENSNRSQMAEAFARLHGSNHLEAFSAGSNPSGQVNPKAIAAMQEKGYDLTIHHSKSFRDLPDAQFDFVITMGCGDRCSHIPALIREDWDLPDPKTLPPDEFNVVRDEIEHRVLDLLTRIN
ncbi:MAG: arsenate reductase ArsC [gamma proteobacterium endosymbiont of Lamellibrachia anaximandri]|nr:arsenate reductase ArsC [gamma proteobacterium endosymbiont of Lamellibrachia anaximandri]